MIPQLAVLVPVLGRPHRVKPLLDSIEATVHGATVLFLADPGDGYELAAIASEVSREGLTIRCNSAGGNYAEKINRGVTLTDEPVLFLGADDLNFHPGWFVAAMLALGPGIGVVGTNDQCNERVIAGEHSTHSLVTRAYTELGTIDDPTKLLHEAYPHEFVDDEFVETAKHRGAYAHAGDAIVEHLHPMAGKAEPDDLYNGMRRRMRRGRPIYRERKPLWT